MAVRFDFSKISESEPDYKDKVSNYFSALMRAAYRAENRRNFENMFSGMSFDIQFNEALEAMEKNNIQNTYLEEYKKLNNGPLVAGLGGMDEAFTVLKKAAINGYSVVQYEANREKALQFDEQTKASDYAELHKEKPIYAVEEEKNSAIASPKKDFNLDIKGLIINLNDGDSLLMRSSEEYKDIQRSLSVMSKIMDTASYKALGTLERRRLASVCMQSVLAKAQKYVDNRRETELNTSSKSYKGKRIKIMREVCSALRAQIDVLPKEVTFRNDIQIDNYDACVRMMLHNTAFSPVMFSEMHTLAASHQEIADNLPGVDILNQKIENVWTSSDSQINKYIDRGSMKALSEGLSGKVVSQKELAALRESLKKYHSTMKIAFENKAFHMSKKEKNVTLPESYRKSMEALAGYNGKSKEFKLKDGKPYSITGIEKLDVAVARYETGRYQKQAEAIEDYNKRMQEAGLSL